MPTELSIQEIQAYIKVIPNRPPFMLTQDLAVVYITQVKHINQAVKRNSKRFPSDFCFQLTKDEVEHFRSQSVTKIYAGTKKLPYGFTREGANMLSTVLHSEVAINRSIQIMRAFSALESQIQGRSENLSVTMKDILKKVEKSLDETQKIAHQMLKMSNDFATMNERMNILETQMDAVMKVKGSFNEKHWFFGKFAESVAEGIELNREEITNLKREMKSNFKKIESSLPKKTKSNKEKKGNFKR